MQTKSAGARKVTAQGIGFVGLRTGEFDATVRLFREVVGLVPAREATDLAGFRLADGTILEIYGPSDEFHRFFQTGPVVGFRVESFDDTRARLFGAGIQFIGDPQHAEGTSWQHFRLPDGTIAEIIGPGEPD
jgi:catechol 2,3-dioxygenase-like lactoylglutathione lyase family enzyme